jgi:hypothetical protein
MTLEYWIQRADFSTTDFAPVDVAGALRALDTHSWPDEWKLLSELENTGGESCPPGIGFVDPGGPFLHVCPGADGRYLVHFHAETAFSLLRPSATTVQTGEDLRRADVGELIKHFFQGQHAEVLRALGGGA